MKKFLVLLLLSSLLVSCANSSIGTNTNESDTITEAEKEIANMNVIKSITLSSSVPVTTGSAGTQVSVSSLLIFCLSHDGEVLYRHSYHRR